MATALPYIIAGAGTILSASAGQKAADAQADAIKQDKEAKAKAAAYSAEQEERLAGQELASSQRAAYEQRRNAALLASKAVAAAAASGAGASDPGVVDIIDRITGEGAYRSALALYEGESAAVTRRAAARSLRETSYSLQLAGGTEAKALSQAGNMQALATLLTGASSMYDIYSKSQVPATTTTAAGGTP